MTIVADKEVREQAVHEQDPCPCDTCSRWAMCRLNRLACSNFYQYVIDIPQEGFRRPNRKVFNDIYSDFIGHDPARHGE